MSKTKFTPGPWRIGKSCGAVVADVPVPGINGSGDVEFYGGHLIAESISSNNRPLIAAAPDLYDFAVWVIENLISVDDVPEAIRRADAVLAKAVQP